VIVPQRAETFERVAAAVAGGGVVAFRTDTFYGLGADPFSSSAVQKIKSLKGREEHKPILVLISDLKPLDRLIEKRSPAFDDLAKRFWPGPLTIIGQATSDVPEELTAGTRTVGVRLPNDDQVRALVRACGGALTATSANPSGEGPARTVEEVSRYFEERIDLIVDGGAAKTDQPSTVVDARGTELKLIREGVIAWAEVQAALDGA
jgi:L-threonylcarbamoyladenylate synthase